MKIIQVGSGGWASGWLSHIYSDNECELTALVSRGGQNLDIAKEKWNIPSSLCFTDYDEALKEDCDVVIIATPHLLHIPFARKAVEAGKNVIVEKPLTDDINVAKAFAKFLKGHKNKVWVSQNFRFRKPLWQMKASFGKNWIGEPAWANVRLRSGVSHKKYTKKTSWQRKDWRLNQTNMLFFELAIHQFDMMRFLVDSDVKTVFARGWNPDWSDIDGVQAADIFLEFNSGFKVNFSASGKSIGFQTGYQGNWLLQTNLGCVRWENGGENIFEPSVDSKAILCEEFFFPGHDRIGVLNEIKRQLKGESGAVPDINDNIKSLAISYAALRSIQENRSISLSEILE